MSEKGKMEKKNYLNEKKVGSKGEKITTDSRQKQTNTLKDYHLNKSHEILPAPGQDRAQWPQFPCRWFPRK